MELHLLVCLLLYGCIRPAQTGIPSRSGTEGGGISLVCGNEGKVVWTKGADGGSSAILTAEGGVITQKLRADPGNRYRVITSDSSLVIVNLSLSDSGTYYCNHDPVVYLTVYPAPPADPSEALSQRTQSTLKAIKPRSKREPGKATENKEGHSNNEDKQDNGDQRDKADTAPPTSSPGVSSGSPYTHSEGSRASPTSAEANPPLSTGGTTTSPPPSPTTPSPRTDGIKIALAVLAAVLLIVTALLLLRCYSRRKAAGARTPDRVYETVNGTAPTTQPGGNEYEFDSDPSASAAPKEYEAVYLLAGDPDVIKLGLKDQSAASPLAPQSTETTPSEALYSTIQAVDV